MPNGTLLEVLQRQTDGWMQVRVISSGETGWTLSASGGKKWIECCKSAADPASQPMSTASRLPPPEIGPSFNCATAKSASARLICSDPELSKADAEIGVAYHDALKEGKDDGDKKAITSMQLAWIKDRNMRCGLEGRNNAPVEDLAGAKSCFLKAYKSQKLALATAFTGASGPRTSFVSGTQAANSPSSMFSDNVKYKLCMDTASACIRSCKDATCEAKCNSTLALCKKDLPEGASTVTARVVVKPEADGGTNQNNPNGVPVQMGRQLIDPPNPKFAVLRFKVQNFTGSVTCSSPEQGGRMVILLDVYNTNQHLFINNAAYLKRLAADIRPSAVKECDAGLRDGVLADASYRLITTIPNYAIMVANNVMGGRIFEASSPDLKNFWNINFNYSQDEVDRRIAEQERAAQAARDAEIARKAQIKMDAETGDPLVGTWQHENANLRITKNGSLYLVAVNHPGSQSTGEYAGPYANDQILIASMFGPITVLEGKKELLFNTLRWRKVTY